MKFVIINNELFAMTDLNYVRFLSRYFNDSFEPPILSKRFDEVVNLSNMSTTKADELLRQFNREAKKKKRRSK